MRARLAGTLLLAVVPKLLLAVVPKLRSRRCRGCRCSNHRGHASWALSPRREEPCAPASRALTSSGGQRNFPGLICCRSRSRPRRRGPSSC